MVNYGCLKVVQLVCIFKEQNRKRAPPLALLAIQCRGYKENWQLKRDKLMYNWNSRRMMAFDIDYR